MTRKTKVKIMQYLLGLACAIGLALAIVMGLGGCATTKYYDVAMCPQCDSVNLRGHHVSAPNNRNRIIQGIRCNDCGNFFTEPKTKKAKLN